MCETAPGKTSSQDAKLLKAAKRKKAQENLNKEETRGKKEEPKLQDNVGAREEVSILSSATLSSFKMSKKRRYALSARSGLKDNRPLPQDTNNWKQLLVSHRRYVYAPKILSKILGLFIAAGSINHTGPAQCSGVNQKWLWVLVAAEGDNSYQTIQNRKGTPSCSIEEVSNILFLCVRKMSEGPPYDEPFIHKQDAHWLLKYARESRYMVQ